VTDELTIELTDEQKRDELGKQLGELYATGKFDEAAKLQVEVNALHQRIVSNAAILAVKLALGAFLPRGEQLANIGKQMREHKQKSFSFRFDLGDGENASPVAQVVPGGGETRQSTGTGATRATSRKVTITGNTTFNGLLKDAEQLPGIPDGIRNAARKGLANMATHRQFERFMVRSGNQVTFDPPLTD
jgi:hypothetical protein